ncbi:MAG: SUMF1/EgtB/PvdO family nonheme iron enzyme [Deltaproteobacteria bacterium]|nr:SUMF1/EgtB/PvdO family nonheme iron enzyme [Deltaproteobacteria bacterium]
MALLGVVFGLALAPSGCEDDYDPGCLNDADCAPDQTCDLATGLCEYECQQDDDCGNGFTCEAHHCLFECLGGQVQCPDADGMASVCGVFCIDVYEASRPDATGDQEGTDETMATSRAGVMPWFTGNHSLMNQAVAEAACQAAGKRLCMGAEWQVVCRGPDELTYSYGDAYDPVTCNGIDTYCPCGPSPGCHQSCPADYHAMPTGAFPECTNAYGVYDINGNVWELVAEADGLDHYRGGAYNCANSQKLHRCDYDATWNPSAKGFRCCADGQ